MNESDEIEELTRGRCSNVEQSVAHCIRCISEAQRMSQPTPSEERYSSCIGSEDIIKQIPAEVFIKAILEDHLTERERRMVSLELQRRNRRCVKK